MSLTTTERRTGIWLLLAKRYRVRALEEPKRAAYWLNKAIEAETEAATT